MYPIFRHFNKTLVAWAMRKFKRLKRHKTRASLLLEGLADKQPHLFVHWKRAQWARSHLFVHWKRAQWARLLDGSGVSREAPAPFWERPEAKSLRPTHHTLHWVLDVIFKEDRSRLRKGNGAHNMALVRHFALNLVRSLATKKASSDDENAPLSDFTKLQLSN